MLGEANWHIASVMRLISCIQPTLLLITFPLLSAKGQSLLNWGRVYSLCFLQLRKNIKIYLCIFNL